MRHYVVCVLFVFCFSVTILSQNTISLKVEKHPIVKVLQQIEKQSGYTFSYNPTLLKDFPPVSVKIDEKSLETVLATIFRNSNIQYIIREKHVILKKRPKNITVSGYIYDSDSHESLIAANIYDAVSQQGAVSNNFGFYSLSLPPSEVRLHPSYVGYQSKTVDFTATNDTVIHFFLKPSSLLQEVVVEGNLNNFVKNVETGKISLNAETIKSIPAFMSETDLIKALQ